MLLTVSGRVKELEKRRILDEAARRRRARKALEALEQDNYQVCSVQNSQNGVLSKIIISTIRAFSSRFSLGTCHCNFSHTIAVGLFPSPHDKKKQMTMTGNGSSLTSSCQIDSRDNNQMKDWKCYNKLLPQNVAASFFFQVLKQSDCMYWVCVTY